MSTKIYDGFVIKKPFTQIIPQLQEYKNMLRPHSRQKLYQIGIGYSKHGCARNKRKYQTRI